MEMDSDASKTIVDSFDESDGDYLWRLRHWSSIAIDENHYAGCIEEDEHSDLTHVFTLFKVWYLAADRDPWSFIQALSSKDGPLSRMEDQHKRSLIAAWQICVSAPFNHPIAQVVHDAFPDITKNDGTFPSIVYTVKNYDKTGELLFTCRTLEESQERVATTVGKYDKGMLQVAQFDREIESMEQEVQAMKEEVEEKEQQIFTKKKDIATRRTVRNIRAEEAIENLRTGIQSSRVVPRKRPADGNEPSD